MRDLYLLWFPSWIRMFSFGRVEVMPTDTRRDYVALPNELWHIVMKMLSLDDLYSLGRVSHKFNQLVTSLPPFSKEFNTEFIDLTVFCLRKRRLLDSPQSHTTVDDLDILSIRLDVTTIGHLNCTLNSPPTNVISTLAPDYRRLASFVSRLQAVENITLKLEDQIDTDGRLFALWNGWKLGLQDLLNACIDAKCTSLEVSQGNCPVSAFSSRSSPEHLRLRDIISPLKRLLVYYHPTREGVGWYQSPRFSTQSSAKIYQSCNIQLRRNKRPQLQTLTIYTKSLLCLPFSDWTYQLIATSSSLTTLVIDNVHLPNSLQWRIVLSWLLEALRFQGVLKSLTFGVCPGLELEPLLNFVEQFKKTLAHLTLTGLYTVQIPHAAQGLRGTFDKNIELPKLATLHGSWQVLTRLVGILDAPRTPDETREILELMTLRYPALEKMVIENPYGITSTFRLDRNS
ncbi:hypothetical protein BDN72DRAFT_961381 [Pluteus cervinus]|uniref:Uncharacterized protein n=1 Tax=Pluteus cervinus TaxID=181527 RepID=A0ACD3AMJ5_9AGAR|nr:hypothetical protein BDN72DRAFT_961381 [Pluteus cervinus]